MEQSEQQFKQDNSQLSYWPSVGIAAVIFGVISFVIYLVSSYTTINSEATGSMFTPSMFIGIFGCLVVAFAGFTAVWHYTNEYDLSLTIGRGALIGFLTGAAVAVVSALLSQAWALIDPNLTQRMIESTVANLENMEIPEESKQQMIDSTVESMRSSGSFSGQVLWGIPINGLLNLLTGMIGAKVFGKKEE